MMLPSKLNDLDMISACGTQMLLIMAIQVKYRSETFAKFQANVHWRLRCDWGSSGSVFLHRLVVTLGSAVSASIRQQEARGEND